MVKMLPIIVNNTIVRSSRGRTPGFGPGNGGSNPSPVTLKYGELRLIGRTAILIEFCPDQARRTN